VIICDYHHTSQRFNGQTLNPNIGKAKRCHTKVLKAVINEVIDSPALARPKGLSATFIGCGGLSPATTTAAKSEWRSQLSQSGRQTYTDAYIMMQLCLRELFKGRENKNGVKAKATHHPIILTIPAGEHRGTGESSCAKAAVAGSIGPKDPSMHMHVGQLVWHHLRQAETVQPPEVN